MPTHDISHDMMNIKVVDNNVMTTIRKATSKKNFYNITYEFSTRSVKYSDQQAFKNMS